MEDEPRRNPVVPSFQEQVDFWWRPRPIVQPLIDWDAVGNHIWGRRGIEPEAPALEEVLQEA